MVDRNSKDLLDATRQPEGAEVQIEALSREVERLRVLASRERGLTEAILTHSPYGILVSDANGKLTLQNKAAEKIWAGSASADSVRDWGKYRAFHPDGRPFEPSDFALARVLVDKQVIEARELHIQRFDDTHAILLAGSAPIWSAAGELAGALTVFTDITKAKALEEELRVGAERYLTTLKSIGDAVIATDGTGKITFLNPVAEALTRWPLEAALGKPLSDVFRIVNEQTRAEVASPVEQVIRAGKIVGLANHTLLIARDGTEIAIDDSGAPIFDSQGALAGVVLVFRDVTEKRREDDRWRFIAKASALLASSLDYAVTLTSLAELSVPTIADWCAIDMVGPDGSIQRLAVAHADPDKVRDAKELETKYPPDPKSPYGVHEVIRSGKSQLIAEIPDALLVEAALDAEHLRVIRAFGLRSSMIVPLRYRDATLGAITFILTDTPRRFGATDLSLAEELASVAALAVENARLYGAAQDANRTKDEFLATMSHELRTPLNAILGWATLLRTSTLSDEKRQHALETIERNARAQARLIEDLLDVSRIISGNLRLELRPLDFGVIIAAAVDAVRLAASAKNVNVEVRLDPNARQGTGDAARLEQVIWNLLTNAVKFTGSGGTVTIALARSDSQAEIRVTDTGIGIEPDFLPHIFERFKQANTTSTRLHGGLGLGLAIVKHLVDLHGGTVSASSAGPNLGSSFQVRLPLAPLIVENVAPSLKLASRTRANALEGLRVLVVDDETDARTLLIAVLEGHGASVKAVASATDALRSIDENPPDVLVSDIAMPGEDGYSLIRKLRAAPKNRARELPAAALSAFARAEDKTRALLAGFQSHIAKPLDPEELVRVVATLAGRTG